MLLCLLLIGPFIAMGLVVGIFSPLIALKEAISQAHHRKWNLYVTRGSKMSTEHNERIQDLAKTLISCSPFSCIDPDSEKRVDILFRFYKLAHTLGVLVQFTIIVAVKICLFVPLWGGIFGEPFDFFARESDDFIYEAPISVKQDRYSNLDDHLQNDNIFGPTSGHIIKGEKSYDPHATMEGLDDNILNNDRRMYKNSSTSDTLEPFDPVRYHASADNVDLYANSEPYAKSHNQHGVNTFGVTPGQIPPEMEPQF